MSSRRKRDVSLLAVQANKLTRDLWIAGEQEPKMDLQQRELLVLKDERPSARSVFSFSPKGPQASILLPESTQPHTRPSCMVSMMDGADARVASNMEKNSAGFIQTEVSVISVSTKQMSLTLERSKNRFTTTAFQFTTSHNGHQTGW